MARRRFRAFVLRAVLFLLVLGPRPSARAALTVVPAKAAAGTPASPVAFLQEIHLSLEAVRLPAPASSGLLPAAPSPAHGVSAQNRGKLISIIARAQASGLPRPGLAPSDASIGEVSEEKALAVLDALNKVLEDISPAQLENPEEVGAIYARLWDGLKIVQAGEPEIGPARRGLFSRLAPRGLQSSRAAQVPAPAAARSPARLDTRQYWEENRGVLLAETQALRAQVVEYARLHEAAIGAEAFNKELDKSKVMVAEPGLGKAEMTLVDGRRIIRVTHARTELSVLFIDDGAVARDSGHLLRLIGRQFFDAGSDRADGRRGRNPVIVWLKDGNISAVDFHEKPGVLSRDWWKWYWRATYKTPDMSDVIFGVVMSIVQGVLAAGLGAVKLAMLGTAIVWAPVAFTMIFGLVIGVFVSTYKNWTYRGRKLSQFLKSALISVAFAYPVIIFTQGLGSVALTGAGLAMHGHVLSNVALNNVGKVAWQQIPAMGEKHRQFTGLLFWKLKKAPAVNQSFYLINWTLRLGDLLGIPGGKVVFLLGIPLAMFLSYWYARKHGFPEAEEMRRLPSRLLRWKRK